MIINLRIHAQRVIITSNEWRHFYYSAYHLNKIRLWYVIWNEIEPGEGATKIYPRLNFELFSPFQKLIIRSRWSPPTQSQHPRQTFHPFTISWNINSVLVNHSKAHLSKITRKWPISGGQNLTRVEIERLLVEVAQIGLIKGMIKHQNWTFITVSHNFIIGKPQKNIIWMYLINMFHVRTGSISVGVGLEVHFYRVNPPPSFDLLNIWCSIGRG